MGKDKGEAKSSIPAAELKANKVEGANRPQSGDSGVAGIGNNVDKIRDILFGSQMRDYEKRFTRLEERMIKEVNTLREESRKRSDSIEDYIKKEMESMGDQLKEEQSARIESDKELAKELEDATKAFEKKTGKLDEQQSKNSRDLRQQILDLSKDLSDDIRKKHEETAAVLEQLAQELRSEKLDRAALSELFVEMAMRLSGDSAIDLGLEIHESQDE